MAFLAGRVYQLAMSEATIRNDDYLAGQYKRRRWTGHQEVLEMVG